MYSSTFSQPLVEKFRSDSNGPLGPRTTNKIEILDSVANMAEGPFCTVCPLKLLAIFVENAISFDQFGAAAFQGPSRQLVGFQDPRKFCVFNTPTDSCWNNS